MSNETIEVIKWVVTFIVGTSSPVFAIYLNNKNQAKREKRKYEYDNEVESSKRTFEIEKNYRF